MRGSKRNFELDMTHGSLIPKVMTFAVPLMLTSILQLLYNAADVIVVGRFAGEESLAAVGSTGALINLIVNVFLGLSVGTNVIAANFYGAGNFKDTQETVHTSITVSLIGGTILAIIGVLLGGTFLRWMDSPAEVLPLATIYIRIFFLGMPFNMLYNFGAAVLRAVGDTRRPLIFLSISGVVNVGLNLVFVIIFHMGVAGVALATIISQMLSSLMVLGCLLRTNGYVHLNLKKLRIHKDKLIAMARVGLPAGFQGACFAISNVMIQSTINTYGATVVAGNSAANNLEGFIYVSMNAFHQAAVTFVSTNIGAGKYSRISKSLKACITLAMIVGVTMGACFFIFAEQLVGIYSPNPEVIVAGVRKFRIFTATYFTCGLMDVLCGAMRGMGATVAPLMVSVLGVCGLRIFWLYAIMPFANSLNVLYYSYPISWTLTAAVHLICFLSYKRKHYPVDLAREAEL